LERSKEGTIKLRKGDKMKAIILLSGGLDSAVAAAWAKREWHEDCLALCFNYGQRHTKEIHCSRRLAEYFGWPHQLLTIKIPSQSALTDKAKDVNQTVRGLPASFVPGRNLIFLSYAASVAYHHEVSNIVGGWNFIDYPGYPDCRPEFLQATEVAINRALGYPEYTLRLHGPLISLNKKEIIQLGQKLKVPFEMTWSCYQGWDKPCGVCGSCKFRTKGFEEAGIKDPLLIV